MIIFNETTKVYQLVSLLCVVGEFPMKSVHLLGNEVWYKRLIKEMCTKQTYHNSVTGEKHTCTALSICKNEYPSVRLKKAALPLMEWVGGAKHWEEAWGKHSWSGCSSTIERNHRVAEVVAMMNGAGLEYRPWEQTVLQTDTREKNNVEEVSFYASKSLKRQEDGTTKQIGFSRFTGALIGPTESMLVYNTRKSVMKWGGKGEAKARSNVHRYTKFNTQGGDIRKMILLSSDFETALATLLQTEKDEAVEKFKQKKKRKQSYVAHTSMTGMYRTIHYVPLNEFGSKMLKILSIPDSREKALSLFYSEEELSHGEGSLICDAYRNGRYVLSFLDGDITRLRIFKESIERQRKRGEISYYAVLCFPEQKAELIEYLGDDINYPTTNIDDVLQDLQNYEESVGDEIYE